MEEVLNGHTECEHWIIRPIAAFKDGSVRIILPAAVVEEVLR
jgi:hypothetical protein